MLDEGEYTIQDGVKFYISNTNYLTGNGSGVVVLAKPSSVHNGTMLLTRNNAKPSVVYGISTTGTDGTIVEFPVTVSQSTGTDQTKVMSQNAVTGMVFADPAYGTKVRIANASTVGDGGVAIGTNAQAGWHGVGIGLLAKSSGNNAIAIGGSTTAQQNSVVIGSSAQSASYGVAIGYSASQNAPKMYSVALGSYSKPSAQGEVAISGPGLGTNGYNNSNYRLISGVYDGQGLHDAATVAQGNTLATSAPTTTTVGVLGQLYTDTTNMHTFQCTAIDTTDPDNPVYAWTQRW